MRKLVAVCLAATALAACGSTEDVAVDETLATSTAEPASTSAPTGTSPATSPVAPTTPLAGDDLSVRESETVSAAGVLSAAVLLASGDVEQAVADGRVTPDEVDEAIAAIESGVLDQWAALAGS